MYKNLIILVIFQLITVGCTKESNKERWTVLHKEDGALRIVTWNIGHYSNGIFPHSQIDEQNYDKKRVRYLNFIHYLDADIICLNEYSHVFAYARRTRLSRKVLFSDYHYIYEFPQYNYSCNSVMSNVLISDLKVHSYYFNSKQDNEPTGPVNYEDYYYLKGQIKLSDKNITFIFTHLSFDDTVTGRIQLQQIQELIDICKNDEYVIMAGDWNTEDYSLFKSNGYDTLIDESNVEGTYPSDDPQRILDNVFIKGLKSVNVYVIHSDLSDHLPVVVDLYI